MGEVRLDGEKLGRLGFWTPPTDNNRAIRKAAAIIPFQRRCDVSANRMKLKVIWEMSDTMLDVKIRSGPP